MRKIHLIQVALIALSTLFMASTCDGIDDYEVDESQHWSINFQNNGVKTIYVNKSFAYPDTIEDINMSVSLPDKYGYNTISPDMHNQSALSMGQPWESIFGTGSIQFDTLIVYVFDKLAIESHVTTVRDALIQRYDLSLQDLQQLDWTLMYPPDMGMKHVKMWPPYRE